MAEEARERPTSVGFKEALARFVREAYDPGVQVKALALMGVGMLLRLDMLGGLFGVIHVSSDSWLFAVFRSDHIIPPARWPVVEKLFLRERERFPRNRWKLKDNGEVVLEVHALRLRGNLQQRLRVVDKRVFRRASVVDRQIGHWFVPRPARARRSTVRDEGKP